MHEHDWNPVAGERGQYTCAGCDQSGYRTRRGRIRAHRHQYPERYERNDREHRVEIVGISFGGGWVQRTPTLGDYDQGLG